MLIQENFVYNYNSFIKDIKNLRKELVTFVKDVALYFDELVNEQADFNTYINVVTNQEAYVFFEDFMLRPHEPFMVPAIQEAKDNFWKAFRVDENTYNGQMTFDECFDKELDRLESLVELWDKVINASVQSPILDLSNCDYEAVGGIQVYFTAETSNEMKEYYKEFASNFASNFPNYALRLDGIIVVSKEYIELVGGDRTMAYFVENSLFVSCEPPEDKTDSIAPHHELGHFIYQEISETSRMFWKRKVDEWTKKGVGLTRNAKGNSQLDYESGHRSIWYEEMFADCIGIMLYGRDRDIPDSEYIHKPDEVVFTTLNFILEKEFEK